MAMKKGVDKWKLKKWFTVHAPGLFNNAVIAEIPANDEKSLINRRVKVGLDFLTHNPQNAFTNMFFKITSVEGTNANTELTKMELPVSYIRSLARKYKSVSDSVLKVASKDNKEMVVKPMVITMNRARSSKIRGIRKEMNEYLKSYFNSNEYAQIINAIVEGRLQAELANKLGHIVQISKVEIKKLEIK